MIYDAFSKYDLISQAVNALGKLGLEGYFWVKAMSPWARRLTFSHLWWFANAHTGRQAVRYGERQRPEHRSKALLINPQVADAPRTVPEITPLSRTCDRNPL